MLLKMNVVDEVVNPDVDERHDVEEVVIFEYQRSGMSLLTSMATHTGVGLLTQG